MKDGDMPKKYEPKFKARAVRLVPDQMSDYGSVTAASVAGGASGGPFGRGVPAVARSLAKVRAGCGRYRP